MVTVYRNDARALRVVSLVALLTLPLLSCGTSTETVGSGASGYLAAVAVDDFTGQIMPGAAPAASNGPSLSPPTNSQGITGGSTTVDLTGSSPFRTLAVWVEGVEGHYLVTLPAVVTNATVILTVAGGPPTLSFDVRFAAADANGVWGPRGTTNLSVISAAGGDIQVSVTWNTDADVDLHVIEPGGTEIFYGNTTSPSGGQLDIDANAACSTSTLFQENIGWDVATAPNGMYIVRVDYWSECSAVQTDYIVTVSIRPGQVTVPGQPGGSSVQTFRGSISGPGTNGGAGSGITITTFTF